MRKEVSIANFTELTKLYNLLTDSLRPIWIQFAGCVAGVATECHPYNNARNFISGWVPLTPESLFVGVALRGHPSAEIASLSRSRG